MENSEIRINSYPVRKFRGLILLSIGFAAFILFFTLALVFTLDSDTLLIDIMIPVGIFGPFFIASLILAFVVRLRCPIFDIYSNSGIKRINGEKTIFDVKWDEVKFANYCGIWWIFFLAHHTLIIDLKAPKIADDRTRSFFYDEPMTGLIDSISTVIKPKMLDKIKDVCPLEISTPSERRRAKKDNMS